MRDRVLGPVILSAALAAGCATLPAATPLLTTAQPTAIILATALIAPDALLSVVTDAVQRAPESAVAIAAAAAAAAPTQASAIRTAVVRLVPADADAIVAVTKVKRRGPVVARVDIPDPDRLAALVERSTR